MNRRKEFSRSFSLGLLGIFLIFNALALGAGEWSSYLLARRYIERHRPAQALLVADTSLDWMRPRLSNVSIVAPTSPLPYDFQHHYRHIWLLEQRATGIKWPLPAHWVCQERTFGWLRYFRLRRCQNHKGKR